MRIGFLGVVAGSLALAACGMVPDGRTVAPARSGPVSTAPVIQSLQGRQCLADLGKAGARFAPLPDKLEAGGCSTSNTVSLHELAGDVGRFSVTNLPNVGCQVAGEFADWARFGVDRAARQILGSGIARIDTYGSYSCRNVAGTNRLSAHSRAGAIDVAAFVLADGRRITVKEGWNASPAEREFLRTVHASACRRFGTVLGPEYNAAHKDHLHLEYGSGSFCR